MEIISRKAIKSGNASAVVLPKSWLNRKVKVELVDKNKETILEFLKMMVIADIPLEKVDKMKPFLLKNWINGGAIPN